MKRGQSVFTEAIGASGDTRTVKRSNGLANRELPAEFDRRVGDRILEWCVHVCAAEGFRSSPPV
jgi:hypothetical protein